MSRRGKGASRFRGKEGRSRGEGEGEGQVTGGWRGNVGSVGTGCEAQGVWPISFVFC